MPHKPVSPGDAEILEAVRALQGGAAPEAFGIIFHRFYRPLHNFFANRPTLREEADDLAQATLLRAYERLGLYRPEAEASFGAWLRTLAENIWKNAVRERRAAKRAPPGELAEPRARPRAEDGLRASTPPPSPQSSSAGEELPDPEAAALARERTRVLRQAIETLPPGMRQCMELRVFGDLEYHEIAAVTGISLNSVRSQLFAARQRLKPILESYFQGAGI
jgi:RNA polymerase sigma factor (sigma-70 family)